MGVFNRIENEIPRLQRYARVLTRDLAAADDLVQDCLARALDKAALWREGTDLRAWLFAILHNQHVNHVRRMAREGASVGPADAASRGVTLPNQTTRLELRDLERALAALPEEQRQVVLLVGLEGMRYEEVATIMNVPVGTVRSRLSRGRDTVRDLIGEHTDTSAGRKGLSRPDGRRATRRRMAAPARAGLG